LDGDGAQETLEALFFRGFHCDDGIQGIDEEKQFVALGILWRLRRRTLRFEIVGQALHLDGLKAMHDTEI
jgi:hypothetical protein